MHFKISLRADVKQNWSGVSTGDRDYQAGRSRVEAYTVICFNVIERPPRLQESAARLALPS